MLQVLPLFNCECQWLLAQCLNLLLLFAGFWSECSQYFFPAGWEVFYRDSQGLADLFKFVFKDLLHSPKICIVKDLAYDPFGTPINSDNMQKFVDQGP